MSRSLQSGLTMIEVLITILVLAIGLTGVMAMESLAIKTNHQAYQHTQAILQAQDLADRMHANLEGVEAGNYAMSTPPTTAKDCLDKNVDCSPSDMATFDLKEWDEANKDLLPASTSTVVYDGTVDVETYTITINWQEEGNDAIETRSFQFVYKPLPVYMQIDPNSP